MLGTKFFINRLYVITSGCDQLILQVASSWFWNLVVYIPVKKQRGREVESMDVGENSWVQILALHLITTTLGQIIGVSVLQFPKRK